MLFSSMIFLWLFLPLIILIYFVINDKCKNVFLLITSLIFYAWGGVHYLVVIFFSIVINYLSGLLISIYNNKVNRKRLVLVLCIIVNITVLFFFKYYDSLFTSINNAFNTNFKIFNLVLPLGISFFTFQSLSYVVDLYRGSITVQKNVFDLALYITFFPQLIAGPIVKYHDIEKQIKNRKVSVESFALGIRRFVYGLSKKVLIANYAAKVSDTIFSYNLNEVTLAVVWLGVIFYSLQIYFDFSGYSDMAIGLGRMFGFDFLENFNYPYISTSIQDFWRRWHISLSTWFKEYVYIPLGGNKKGVVRTYVNNFIVFLLTGIWHGASFNFWFWGLYHGFFIIVEKMGFSNFLKNNRYKFLNHMYVLIVVSIGWAIFRCNSMSEAYSLLYNMFSFHQYAIYDIIYFMSNETWLILILGIFLSGPIQNLFNSSRLNLKTLQLSWIELGFQSVLLLLCISSLSIGSYNPFIYFRF